MGPSNPVPKNPCPSCRANLGAATSVAHQAPPHPGDVSVCYHCGAFLEYDANLQSIPIRPQTWANIQHVQPETAQQMIHLRQHLRQRDAIRKAINN